MDMEKLCINNYEFLSFNTKSYKVVFSTAKNGLNFNINCKEGMENINNIKQWFGVSDVGFLRQTHSDKIYVFDGIVHEGDALITSKQNIAIGVFTADCVPIIIADEIKGVVSAVHSGWKGTLDCIVIKTIEEMKKLYGCESENIRIFIGPHNKNCCYDVGEELIRDFDKVEIYKGLDICNMKNLDLQRCICIQLDNIGIKKENIVKLEICTFCNKDYKLSSYRRDKENAGRMFSFIILK